MNKIRTLSYKIQIHSLGKCYSTEHNLITSLLNMRRNDKNNQELKKIRMKIKEKSSKYVPGTVTLQVLGSGAWGAPQSLYIFTDQTRYLFNVGEGCQRLAHEHKMKLSKLEHIFITQPKWANIGGLPGVALTIQDVGVPEITLHGPPGTSDLFPATRRFVVLNDLSINMAECNEDTQFEDCVMTVKYVPITGTNGKNPDEMDGVQVMEDDDVNYYSRCKESEMDLKRAVLPKERVPSVVMCYICKLKPKAGTLSLEACVERGVPPGPLLGRLKNGEDITLPDGTVVRSSDVTNPEQPGPVVLVIDCPNEDYLESLTTTSALTDPNLQPHAIVHFTPSNIQSTTQYQTWLHENFPNETTHLNLNKTNTCIGSVAIHRIQHMLHMIHPKIFPLLNCTVGETTGTMTSLHLRPLQPFIPSSGLSITPDEYINEPFNTEEFRQLLGKFQSESDEPGTDYPRIVFLGTGSCIPNKTRNTSGILIHMSEDDVVLLDCGEGTFNQIVRFYGVDGARDVLRKLRMVYISHLHADHHIGLIGLLKGHAELLSSFEPIEPVYLLAPQQIMTWLQFYHIRFENILSYFKLIPNTGFRAGNARFLSETAEKLISDLHCSDIGTVLVRHCPNAFGIAITHKNGWKLTYSGDTMPCDDLVSLGYGSDILIHEATMEDELEEEAKFKFHSTTSQALHVGRTMHAKFTLLTHFSQRYAKLPRLQDNIADNVGIAFDNMQVTLKQLPLLSKMLPALKLMFAEHVDEMDAKALKRSVRKQLKRPASPSLEKSAKVPC